MHQQSKGCNLSFHIKSPSFSIKRHCSCSMASLSQRANKSAVILVFRSAQRRTTSSIPTADAFTSSQSLHPFNSYFVGIQVDDLHPYPTPECTPDLNPPPPRRLRGTRCTAFFPLLQRHHVQCDGPVHPNPLFQLTIKFLRENKA